MRLECNAFTDLQPLQRAKNRSNMIKFRSRNNRASKSILDTLKTSKLRFRKTNIKRVTVVKFRMNKRSSNSTGSFMTERRTNTMKITNVLKAASGERRNLIIKSQMLVKYETEITCRERR
jgi:hypothetical protein